MPRPALRADAIRLVSMPPVLGPNPRILVLGSMPGAKSLAERQYYAHPQNQFWRIIEDVFAIPRQLPYAIRTARLREHGVALWDVLATCSRNGSLDAHIRRDTMQANDIAGLLTAHRSLRRVLFNGAFAENVYRRQVRETSAAWDGVIVRRLPSTSPANAASRYAAKLAAWREALGVER